MLGKFDSFRDSMLYFLCAQGWENASFGDNDYGVYVWRISLARNDIFGCFDQGNMEFDSLIEEELAELEAQGANRVELLNSLVGHFMVSENSQGQVTVKQYTLESELIRHFTNMQEHYSTWSIQTEMTNEGENY